MAALKKVSLELDSPEVDTKELRFLARLRKCSSMTEIAAQWMELGMEGDYPYIGSRIRKHANDEKVYGLAKNFEQEKLYLERCFNGNN